MITKSKKGGAMGILLIIGALFLLVLIGLAMLIGSAVINWSMDNLMPEVASIGMVDNANVTEDVNYALKPVNNFIQNFTWITGLIYIFGIIAIFGLAFAFKSSGDKWLMGLFFGLVLILIIACIILSNIYEEFYNGTDTDFTPILQEHVILSYLILYSPAIMSILAFFAGIILFSGPSEEGI